MEHESLQPVRASEVSHLTATTIKYMDHLAEVQPWLDARGIDMVAANTFHLGYVADPIPGHEMYKGTLAIPYRGESVDGGFHPTLTMRFRCVRPHEGACKDLGHPKYMTMKGDTSRMFNVPAIVEATTEIHVAEGELDAVLLNRLGYPAVALPGALQWKRHHSRMLAGFDRVFIWGDPDEAGSEMVSTICKHLRQAIPVRLKNGDVGETYLSEPWMLAEALEEAMS